MNFFGAIKKIVWSIFPPESDVERFIRTQFHYLTSRKPYVSWKIYQSEKSYLKWYHEQKNRVALANTPFSHEPMVSFFLSIEQSDLALAKRTIHSILNQANKNWELLILGSSQLRADSEFQKLVNGNMKIREFSEIENPLPSLLENSMGEYFLCCNPGDTFEIYLIDHFYESINLFPDSEIIYSDNDVYSVKSSKVNPFFKPDIYSPELHLSINYLSRSFIKKKLATTNIGSINPEFNLINQEWELLFLLKEENAVDRHIPLVLWHQIQDGSIPTQQECLVIERHLKRTGIKSEITVNRNPETKIRWNFGQPSVSIVIPTKNNCTVLHNLLHTLFEVTNYPNFEVILVDNNSNEEALKTYYSRIVKDHPIRIVNFNEEFNYSRANNLGASLSQSDLLLFINNDMEIIDPEWLNELCQWSMVEEIGVVGAKLLHMENTIQHAGVILGLQGFVGHLYLDVPDHYHGIAGSVDWYRNLYAVTGACQMMRKTTFTELGGYDENFQLVFSDIDLCLRAIKKGYRNLYTPNAVLKHLEGKSRGYKSPNKDILRGFDLFMEWIQKEDPYYSPNLTYTTIPMCRWGQGTINHRSAQIEEKRKYIQRAI